MHYKTIHIFEIGAHLLSSISADLSSEAVHMVDKQVAWPEVWMQSFRGRLRDANTTWTEDMGEWI